MPVCQAQKSLPMSFHHEQGKIHFNNTTRLQFDFGMVSFFFGLWKKKNITSSLLCNRFNTLQCKNLLEPDLCGGPSTWSSCFQQHISPCWAVLHPALLKALLASDNVFYTLFVSWCELTAMVSEKQTNVKHFCHALMKNPWSADNKQIAH